MLLKVKESDVCKRLVQAALSCTAAVYPIRQRCGICARSGHPFAGTALRWLPAILFAALTFAPGQQALARVWLVGPDQPLKKPSEAARQADDGDTVQVEPLEGGYYDCAVWRQKNLVVEGIGAHVRLTDTTCQGKAIFIISGTGVTIRNLTFARARVPDGNGAGIRTEGGELLVEHSEFINNQVALLAANHPGAVVTIRDSEFRDNGTCRDHCTDTLSVGVSTVLRVEGSAFKDNHGRDVIRLSAAATELLGNDITESDAPTRGYSVELPDGGSLVMRGNTLRWQGELATRAAVLLAGGYGSREVERLIAINNTVVAQTGSSATALIRNWSARDAQLATNSLPPGINAVSSSGYLWFLTKSYLHPSYDTVHGAAQKIVSKIYHLFGR